MDSYTPRLKKVRDPVRFRKRISGIPLRILVEGTRGKTSTVILLEEELRARGFRTLAKVTGHDPMFIWNGTRIPIIRDNVIPLLDFDNVPGILDFDCDVLILENQAITPYTMRYIHALIDPQHVLIPNIRVDHTEGLGETLREMAENFAKNYRVTIGTKNVYYGENIDTIRGTVIPVFRTFAARHPGLMNFFEVAPDPRNRGIPYIENLSVVSLFMDQVFGTSLDITGSLDRMLQNLSIRTSPDSIRYLDLAKVNDPVSFLQILRYAFRDSDEGIALVGYFRKDRAGRNIIFEQIFPELELIFGDRIRKIWFAGYGAEHSCRRLPPAYRNIAICPVEITGIDAILSDARENNLVLVTICNRVNPFMDTLMEKLGVPPIAHKEYLRFSSLLSALSSGRTGTMEGKR